VSRDLLARQGVASKENVVSLVPKVLLGVLVWMVLTVPGALWAAKALKARREEMEQQESEWLERQARRDRMGSLERKDHRDRRGPPSWDRQDRRVPPDHLSWARPAVRERRDHPGR
jgi:hypothetical protein